MRKNPLSYPQTIVYPNVVAELARNGLSVAMLAEHMQMSRQNVYAKLNGKTKINVEDMKKIQEFIALNGGGAFTLDYLFNNV